MQSETWVSQQIQTMRALEGRTIVSWRGVHMAFSGGENAEPAIFRDPLVPCMQFLRLDLSVEDGKVWTITTYQSDDGWGLFSNIEAPPMDSDGWGGIYRYDESPDLPVGRVDNVEIWASGAGDLAEIKFDVAAQQVLLIAGEVYEDWNRPLRVVWLDESVLVFKSQSDAGVVDWVNNRQPIRQTNDPE